ncbi:MAG: RecX family transcriptional regulator [Emcibacter sp.]|nr:RecX family transcriptional regulator [Emcibacter sp.]
MEKEVKKKRPLSRDYLVRATYNYLQRFATTEKNLRAVLGRKVHRRMPESDDGALQATAMVWIDEIVQKAVAQNLVNDRQYAEAKARSLMRSGNSTRTIHQKLLAKGIAASLATEVMAALAEEFEDMDFLAAVKYARKRRFGAFSIRHDGNELVEKELASMCRAGFSYGLANRILMMPREELEDILYGL